MAVGACPVNTQRPSFSILMGTGSYRAGSRCLKIDAAEAIDTSCSPDLPPKMTPTRSLDTGTNIGLLEAASTMGFEFNLHSTDGGARRGEFRTPHGVVQTPAFMPVGTQGSVKAMLHRDLEEIGAEIILGNTYHLFLRPGDEVIARRGGLHRFIGWRRPMLTDSGGYQIFSLAARRSIREEGADFRSHLDGTRHLLTPERAVDIQSRLGADIAMVLDECLAYPASRDDAAASMQRSVRWAGRCRQ